MQSNLRSLFAGKREVIELPPKRGPGRPPKAREREVEEPDEVLEALQSQPEAYDEHLRLRNRKRKVGCIEGPASTALIEAAGKTLGEMRMPGAMRDCTREGPQVKLRLCKWFEKTHEDLGGSCEHHEMLLSAVAENWALPRIEIVRMISNKAKWRKQCEERGVSDKGLARDEAQLPTYLRKSKACKGVVRRAKGGGRIDKLRFLYPIVKDFFEAMRVHGRFIDAHDLEDYLQHTMQRYLDEAAKPGVSEALENTKAGRRVEIVKEELAKLRDPKTTRRTHENRQAQLMRFCGARLRTPQRLAPLTINEERARWMTTLQNYDRLLWEAMRPEHLEESVVDPKAFVEGIEDTVVIHADQVPCWLRIGSMKQLFGKNELKKHKRHELVEPHLSTPGAQKASANEVDGMAQTRQFAKSEGDRFRVTLELSQVVTNVFKPSEKPEVKHGRPVLVVPGCHGRLSNIDEHGMFIEDEVFNKKGKQKVRRAMTSAGNLMLSWRKLRDEGDAEVRGFFQEIEVMQQPAAFCDGVIIAWITEMRKREGYGNVISVRDMFAGGLSASCKRMSAACGHLLAFIAGKMTPVLQLTDVGVAFSLKKMIEATKCEMRREKRGQEDLEAACFMSSAPNETKCDSGDLLRIVGRAWKLLKERDERDEPERLLKVARSCGWLSYRADPVRKVLIKCDQEDWMKGREEELPEKTHRHPSAWWEQRYTWINEEGEPRKADFKTCGRNVCGLEYMRDEFPEQAPNESTRLHCLQGAKVATLSCIDLTEEDIAFPEVARNLVPAEFLRTQREKFEAARMRALTNANIGKKTRKLSAKARKMKMKRKLLRQKRKSQLSEFLTELRSRAAEGYSTRQLIKSHIPDIGNEVKVAASEVTAALRSKEAANF